MVGKPDNGSFPGFPILIRGFNGRLKKPTRVQGIAGLLILKRCDLSVRTCEAWNESSLPTKDRVRTALMNLAEFKLLLVEGGPKLSPLSCKTGCGLGSGWHF